MGFYYMLLILIGIIFLIVGETREGVPRSVKVIVLLFVLGIHFIVLGTILLMPGSDEIIANLLNLE